MGFLLLLKFALLCIDFFAWPVIALAYPLFASIRAVETGSKYHMRKMVIYWTLFSLISLFECAFVKIIEWIPFWSSIKLAAIFWLAMPRFHGACYVYKSFIRPCLVMNIQEVIRRFEEQSCTKETFLDDVADKYIKENGLEALEKLIATKRKCKELVNSQRNAQLGESDEKNDASTGEQAQPLNKETTHAAVVTKGITTTTQTLLIPENRNKPSIPPPLKKVEPTEWTCSLCHVTTTCENNLNAHLRGKKHKSMCESLKSSKLNAQDLTRPSSSSSSTGKDGIYKQESSQNPQGRVSNQQHWCGVCKLLLSDTIVASHFKGKRHSSNVKKMVVLKHDTDR